MGRASWLGAMATMALLACDADGMRDGGPREDGGASTPDAGALDASAFDASTLDGASHDGGPPDGGGSQDASGSECPASGVQVVESCPAFAACGGALHEGERCYDGLCIERAELLAPMLPYCAEIMIEAATGTVRGRMSLRDGELTRASTTDLGVRIRFPSGCVVNGCDEVETLTRSQLTRFAVRCAMTDTCRCDLTLRDVVERSAPYAADASAGVLTVGAGEDAQPHEYCVAGGGALHVRTPVELGVRRLRPPR